MKLYETTEALDKAIESIAKRSKTLQQDVHKAASSILRQWYQTGDVRPVAGQLNRLVDALGKGMRANALRDWITLYSTHVFNTEEKVFVKGKATKIKEGDVKEAIQNPWYELKAEPEYKPMDFDDMLKAMIKRVESRVSKGVTPEDDINLEHLKAVKKILAA